MFYAEVIVFEYNQIEIRQNVLKHVKTHAWGYLENPWTDTVCTNFDTFFMLNPNMIMMKSGIFEKVYYIFWMSSAVGPAWKGLRGDYTLLLSNFVLVITF